MATSIKSARGKASSRWPVAIVFVPYCPHCRAFCSAGPRRLTFDPQRALQLQRQQKIGKLVVVGAHGCQYGEFDKSHLMPFSVSRQSCDEITHSVGLNAARGQGTTSRIFEVCRYSATKANSSGGMTRPIVLLNRAATSLCDFLRPSCEAVLALTHSTWVCCRARSQNK